MLITRYIFSRVLTRSLTVALLLALICVLVDVATTGPYWATRVGWPVVVQAALLHLPLHLVIVTPIATLLTGTQVVANLNRTGELEAISACGAPPTCLGAALLGVGLVLLIISASVSETLVPPCERLSARLYRHRRASSLTGHGEASPWYTGPDGWLVRVSQPKSGDRTRSFLALRLDSTRRVTTRARGSWWPGANGQPRLRFDRATRDDSALDTRSLAAFLATELRDRFDQAPAEALSARQLWQRVRRAEGLGRSSRLDRLLLQTKLAYPLLNLLTGLVVWLIALGAGQRSATDLLRAAVGWTFGIWLLVVLGWQAAQAQILSPVAGAWAPLGVAAMLMLRSAVGLRRSQSPGPRQLS